MVTCFLVPNRRTNLDAVIGIHSKEPHRRAADGRQSDNDHSANFEVRRPPLSPWIEEGDDPSRLWIDCGEIGSLVEIASGTSESEVSKHVIATVLAGLHVLDLKSCNRGSDLRKPAVLAPIAGSAPHPASQRVVHRPFACVLRSERAFDCSTVTKSIAET